MKYEIDKMFKDYQIGDIVEYQRGVNNNEWRRGTITERLKGKNILIKDSMDGLIVVATTQTLNLLERS